MPIQLISIANGAVNALKNFLLVLICHIKVVVLDFYALCVIGRPTLSLESLNFGMNGPFDENEHRICNKVESIEIFFCLRTFDSVFF